jgi:hypothetical protein
MLRVRSSVILQVKFSSDLDAMSYVRGSSSRSSLVAHQVDWFEASGYKPLRW